MRLHPRPASARHGRGARRRPAALVAAASALAHLPLEAEALDLRWDGDEGAVLVQCTGSSAARARRAAAAGAGACGPRSVDRGGGRRACGTHSAAGSEPRPRGGGAAGLDHPAGPGGACWRTAGRTVGAGGARPGLGDGAGGRRGGARAARRGGARAGRPARRARGAARGRRPLGRPRPGELALMRRVKERFDPQRHVQPGPVRRRVCDGLRRHPPAGARPHRRLRALRLLPADVPDLPALGRGDGLAARAHRADAGRARGRPGPLAAGAGRGVDNCLGCMACVTACPSGVQYDKLIEDTRGAGRAQRRRARRAERAAPARDLRALHPPRPAARRSCRCSALQRRAAARAACSATALPARCARCCGSRRAPALRAAVRRLPAVTARARRAARRVGFLQGCVQRVFFGDVNAATVAVLAAEGFEVARAAARRAAAARCSCTRATSGEARELAQADDRGLRGLRRVVVNAAGCGSAMKDYGHLLRDDPAWGAARRGVRRQGPRRHRAAGRARARAPRRPLRLRVAYHDACHLAHAQGVRAQPRELLRGDPRPRAASSPPGGRSAAARPASTTCSSPSRRPSSAGARSATCSPPAPRRWPPPTRAARCRSPRTPRTLGEAAARLPPDGAAARVDRGADALSERRR